MKTAKTDNDGFCPECGIGLNNLEISLRFCQNCKAHWEEEEREPYPEDIPCPTCNGSMQGATPDLSCPICCGTKKRKKQNDNG